LREAISLEGVPLNIIDTAGLRDSADEVERLGIERAWSELDRADVVLMLFDASTGVTAEDRKLLARLPQAAHRIHVFNKIDLAGLAPEVRGAVPQEILISAKADVGIDLLQTALLQAAGWDRAGESLFVARARHLRALSLAGERLGAAATQHAQLELFAEELRLAQEALAGITGEFSADDLLGEIFSRFCIGK
jgi:tRNA modification GTPase